MDRAGALAPQPVTAADDAKQDTNTIKTLTPEQAWALPKNPGSLKALTVEQATALAALHKSDLILDSLTTLSDQAAAALRANREIVLPDKFRQ